MLKQYNIDQFINEYANVNNVAEQSVQDSVIKICQEVRINRDKALKRFTKMFDKVDLEEIEVSKIEMEKAYNSVDKDWLDAIKKAKTNIEDFHTKQLEQSWFDTSNGVIRGELVRPIEKVGIYVPGGTASYPSSVLMNAIPAKVAGVDRIFMTTPPKENGLIPKETLAAAYLVGVEKVYKIGGAQAIAALAYGTESVTKVDKIVGPGNMYVTEAKRYVYGNVGIDMLAGPSEVCILANETTNPVFAASDLLAQAEHDPMARVILISTDKNIVSKINKQIENQLNKLPRKGIASQSIKKGAYVIVKSYTEAANLVNTLAPEHLEIAIDNPFDVLDLIRNAGSIFLGHYAAESLGDYYAGVNHVLPTSQTARFTSSLSVRDFYTVSGVLYYTKQALKNCSNDVVLLAEKEGLTGHANAIRERVKNE